MKVHPSTMPLQVTGVCVSPVEDTYGPDSCWPGHTGARTLLTQKEQVTQATHQTCTLPHLGAAWVQELTRLSAS